MDSNPDLIQRDAVGSFVSQGRFGSGDYIDMNRKASGGSYIDGQGSFVGGGQGSFVGGGQGSFAG